MKYEIKPLTAKQIYLIYNARLKKGVPAMQIQKDLSERTGLKRWKIYQKLNEVGKPYGRTTRKHAQHGKVHIFESNYKRPPKAQRIFDEYKERQERYRA